jgi:hypothetical protein
MRFKISFPVICEYEDYFREPEGDVIGDRYPYTGEGIILCDKHLWIVTAIEGDPNFGWPKVICHRADETTYIIKETPQWVLEQR